MRLEDARALVTGRRAAGSFALELARAGAVVAAVDVSGDGLRALAEEAAGFPGCVETLVGDVSDEEAVRAFVRDAGERLAGINVLVNNAAVLMNGVLAAEGDGWVRRLPALWHRVLDVSFTGQFICAREVAVAMLERRGGRASS